MKKKKTGMTDQGHHIAMLRNRARPWSQAHSRSQLRRIAIQEGIELTIEDIEFWETTIPDLDEIEPTDQELREIEAEEYRPPAYNPAYLDDLPVISRYDDDEYPERDPYEDY